MDIRRTPISVLVAFLLAGAHLFLPAPAAHAAPATGVVQARAWADLGGPDPCELQGPVEDRQKERLTSGSTLLVVSSAGYAAVDPVSDTAGATGLSSTSLRGRVRTTGRGADRAVREVAVKGTQHVELQNSSPVECGLRIHASSTLSATIEVRVRGHLRLDLACGRCDRGTYRVVRRGSGPVADMTVAPGEITRRIGVRPGTYEVRVVWSSSLDEIDIPHAQTRKSDIPFRATATLVRD